MNDQIITQFVLAYIGTHLIQWLKRAAKLPWITDSTDKINKMVGALVALLATAGIGLATTWDAGAGTFTLTLTGLSLSGLVSFAWSWFQQYIIQQATYHGMVKLPAAAGK